MIFFCNGFSNFFLTSIVKQFGSHVQMGLHLIKYQPYAVWRRQGARLALLRCPIPHDGSGIVLCHAGGLKR